MSLVLLDMQVCNQNRVHSHRFEIRNHFFKVRKILAVHREWRVALLIINVEINGVRRNFVFPQTLDNFICARLGIVGVSALLVAQ